MLVRLRHGYRQWLVSGGYLFLLLVGAELESRAGWQYSAFATALLALVAWVMTLRRARAIADTPTSSIGSAAQGYVELIGRGKALDTTPLLAPLTGLPCLWYRFKVERKHGNKWATESSGESTDSFLINDGSGECVVDPQAAEILPQNKETWHRGDHRYTQAVLTPGEQIYVLGEFRTWGGDTLRLDRREDIKFLLAEWKKDMPALLRRFDLDGDGSLDMREWQLARSQARREVERNHRELRAAPAIHMINRPKDGRLYLISSLPPEKLQRHYVRWAFVHVTVFLASLSGAAFLITPG